jgi:hypothetical protein
LRKEYEFLDDKKIKRRILKHYDASTTHFQQPIFNDFNNPFSTISTTHFGSLSDGGFNL